jgi:hypothetical protein
VDQEGRLGGQDQKLGLDPRSKVARSRKRDFDDQEGRLGGQDQELGLDPRSKIARSRGRDLDGQKGALSQDQELSTRQLSNCNTKN